MQLPALLSKAAIPKKGKGDEEGAPLENMRAIENLFSLVTSNKKVIKNSS